MAGIPGGHPMPASLCCVFFFWSVWLLPTNRTERTTAFEVAGVDFAGLIPYCKGSNQEGKDYIALLALQFNVRSPSGAFTEPRNWQVPSRPETVHRKMGPTEDTVHGEWRNFRRSV